MKKLLNSQATAIMALAEGVVESLSFIAFFTQADINDIREAFDAALYAIFLGTKEIPDEELPEILKSRKSKK